MVLENQRVAAYMVSMYLHMQDFNSTKTAGFSVVIFEYKNLELTVVEMTKGDTLERLTCGGRRSSKMLFCTVHEAVSAYKCNGKESGSSLGKVIYH